MTPSFRGFGPWSCDPIASGSMDGEAGHHGKKHMVEQVAHLIMGEKESVGLGTRFAFKATPLVTCFL